MSGRTNRVQLAAAFAAIYLRGLVVRPWRDWSHAAVSGVLLFVGCHGALAYARRFVPSGLSVIILATIPFWIALSTSQSVKANH
jgi:drug/metabolite transporter (DMT)-like permease